MNANTSFRAKVPSAVLGGTAATASTGFPFLDSGGSQLVIYFPDSKKADCLPFRLLVAGRCTGGAAACTFLTTLSFGVAATIAGNTTIETCPAMTVTSLNANFFIEGKYIWDSTSGVLGGAGWSYGSITNGTGTLTALTLMDASPTAATTWNTAASTIAFSVFGTWGTNAQAANAAYITEFSLEML